MCFVIMGYGLKTDLATGRTLDLDKTYTNIIKPAVESISGLQCFRSDDIKHSGMIDCDMYRYLFEADIVIADLSTYNSNAIYELGIRHALKPRTTVVISEKELKCPFDVDHVVINRYEHLGKDIGYTEVIRFKGELIQIIKTIIANPKTDSPVYTFLHQLMPPYIGDSETMTYQSHTDSLRATLDEAIEYMDKEKNYLKAIEFFELALEIDNGNTYILQKLALATYKAEAPNKRDSLLKALSIMEPLKIDTSNDPETIGLHGAIYKRLWELEKDNAYLDKSLKLYNKGFILANDYYNGINAAYLHNVRASISEGDEKITDYTMASRIRKDVIQICEKIVTSGIDERNDAYWIYATLEEAFFALGNIEMQNKYNKLSMECTPSSWQRESTDTQIGNLKELIDR